MPHLYQVLADASSEWRREGFPCDPFPVIGEILDWQTGGVPLGGSRGGRRWPCGSGKTLTPTACATR